MSSHSNLGDSKVVVIGTMAHLGRRGTGRHGGQQVEVSQLAGGIEPVVDEATPLVKPKLASLRSPTVAPIPDGGGSGRATCIHVFFFPVRLC